MAGKRQSINLAGPSGVSPKKAGRKPGWRKVRHGDAGGPFDAAGPATAAEDAAPRAAASLAPAARQPQERGLTRPRASSVAPTGGAEDAAAAAAGGGVVEAARPPQQGPKERWPFPKALQLNLGATPPRDAATSASLAAGGSSPGRGRGRGDTAPRRPSERDAAAAAAARRRCPDLPSHPLAGAVALPWGPRLCRGLRLRPRHRGVAVLRRCLRPPRPPPAREAAARTRSRSRP